MQDLPDNLYRVDSVVKLEQLAIKQYAIPAYELMQRAGQAVFDLIVSRYTSHKKILIVCGAGNNAGDGYVVAKLARQASYEVLVISLIDPADLKNEALLAYQDWLQVGVNQTAEVGLLEDVDLIVDALLGSGISRDVSSEWSAWFKAINASAKPVIAVDLPSGLFADTGAIAGCAIQAEITVCFIALKQGMFTARAKDVCGEIVFDSLGIDESILSQLVPDARLVKEVNYSLLAPRKASSHKGNFGHVLIAGGNAGMPGAVILAARAALRTGAGLITILTVAENLQAISNAVPEAMVKTADVATLTDELTCSLQNTITHVAVGMGLGQDDWALQIFRFCLQLKKPLVIDADALNLLAKHKIKIQSPLVLTPHPGEAASLLSLNGAVEIQQNRFSAIKKLHKQFSGSNTCVLILKGSGTLIFDAKTLKICLSGNAAMAAPGMGDVLSGIIIALMAQKIKISDAAEIAVCLHASAAESITQGKTRGLLASDVVQAIPELLL